MSDRATFGAGCFWCVEAIFEQIDGVLEATPGYMGGHLPNPGYHDVCAGQSGHAEVVQARFDPARIGYRELVDWFWALHDPTTPNRQGADVGPQYRSAIFYHDAAQRETAEASLRAAQPRFERPIVTEISPASEFYPAEDHHQDYFSKQPDAPYCQIVIHPKLRKLGLMPSAT